jgi:hypothetical protein
MILKLGYTDLDGINVFRYVEDFTELKITPFLTTKYKYNKESNMVIYNKKHDVQGVDLLFNPKILEDNEVKEMNITYLYFLDTKTSTYISYACLSDSVFLMNDNGKTIDKY